MVKKVDDWVIVVIVILAALLVANLFVSGTIFSALADIVSDDEVSLSPAIGYYRAIQQSGLGWCTCTCRVGPGPEGILATQTLLTSPDGCGLDEGERTDCAITDHDTEEILSEIGNMEYDFQPI
jgi:hypothetical protein